MFRERVVEGQRKQAEWRRILKRLRMDDENLSDAQAAIAARKELGYEGAAKERVEYCEWLSKKAGNDTRYAAKQAGKATTFEYAISKLPDKGDPQEAIKWIQAHPAMARKARMKTDANVLLTAEDVLNPPHGRAPSRYAATALQTWVNDPENFFKISLNEQKKNVPKDDTIKDAAAELSIEEMETMLKSMAS